MNMSKILWVQGGGVLLIAGVMTLVQTQSPLWLSLPLGLMLGTLILLEGNNGFHRSLTAIGIKELQRIGARKP